MSRAAAAGGEGGTVRHVSAVSFPRRHLVRGGPGLGPVWAVRERCCQKNVISREIYPHALLLVEVWDSSV